MPRWWFDAHLDLAYLAVRGRDLRRPLAALNDATQGPHPPAGVTLPALRDAGVRMILGTIFTEVVPTDHAGALTAEQYRAGDADAAHRRGRAQLEVYRTWSDEGEMALDLAAGLHAPEGVGTIRGGMGVSEVVPTPPDARAARLLRDERLHLGILMENADPIRAPDELPWWVERGVCMIGLTWARSGRYARGNTADPADRVGLTPLGRELVAGMDRLGVLHDVSHLSDRALDDLFDATPRRVVASHSNCRALLDRDGQPPNQRHLTDRAIREITRRDGVIGLNLFSGFLVRGEAGEKRRATVDEALAHVDRICELTGNTRHVGLGSDLDGGFGADRLPVGIDQPAHFRRLADGLTRRGWTMTQVEDFAWRNWARVWG
ncbi:MAG: peptidase [Phycisphaerae bacterium]|nr:MAG: peptidase [Phycisphaerae bacterium]